jgi:hypothetical protein
MARDYPSGYTPFVQKTYRIFGNGRRRCKRSLRLRAPAGRAAPTREKNPARAGRFCGLARYENYRDPERSNRVCQSPSPSPFFQGVHPMFASWLRRALRLGSARRSTAPKGRPLFGSFRPELENLEDRLVRSVTPGITSADAFHADVYCSDRGDLVIAQQSGTVLSVNRYEPDVTGQWVNKDSRYFNLSTPQNFTLTFHGGAGNDTLSASSVQFTVYAWGQGGNDTLTSGSGDDFLYGGDGDDVLDAGPGNDYLSGDRNNDILRGGSGNDTYGFAAHIQYEGYDTIYETTDPDVDTLDFSATLKANEISATAGNLTIDLANPGWVCSNLHLTLASGWLENANGGAGDDTINGTSWHNALSGGGGNDTINGGGGNDTIWGGTGDDYIHGGDGNDYIDGGSDEDWVYGDAGYDFLYGGDGNDIMYGGGDDDEMHGGAGNDYLSGDDGNDTISGGDDNDTLIGGNGNDTLSGDGGWDTFESREQVLSQWVASSGQVLDTVVDHPAEHDVLYIETINGFPETVHSDSTDSIIAYERLTPDQRDR